MELIYLDNNATTPLDPRVLDAMMPYLTTCFANAASLHAIGRQAAEAVERARGQTAALIGAEPGEIIWTSGSTESCNLALQGVARHYQGKGRHIVIQSTEHRAVLDTARSLQSEGFEVSAVPVDHFGRVELAAFEAALRADTILASVMLANNETGTLQPIREISELCRARGVHLHTDATQAVGRIPVDVGELGVDLLSASAHKFHGPKGVGILFLRRSSPPLRCRPLIHGGGHEQGLRSGTANVPAIVGMGAAGEIARAELPGEGRRLAGLRDALFSGLQRRLGDLTVHGHPVERLPGTLHVSFAGVEAEALMARCPEIAVSTAAACTSAATGPSHVLKAMNVPDDQIYSSIRFSIGRFNTAEQIERVVEFVTAAVEALRRTGA